MIPKLELNKAELITLFTILEREIPKELENIDKCPESIWLDLVHLELDKAPKTLLKKVTSLYNIHLLKK